MTKKWKYNHFYAFLSIYGEGIYLMILPVVNDFLLNRTEKLLLDEKCKEAYGFLNSANEEVHWQNSWLIYIRLELVLVGPKAIASKAGNRKGMGNLRSVTHEIGPMPFLQCVGGLYAWLRNLCTA